MASIENARANVYLRRLQYERPVSVTSNPITRYMYQDALIANSIKNQEVGSQELRSAASNESVAFSRYGLIYKQLVDLITGFPEYLR